MLLNEFERFTKRGRTFKPKVSVRARGSIGLNNGAIQKFSLDKYNYAILYMSKKKDRIAIQFTNNKDEDGAIKLVKRPGNCFFSGKSFLDYHSIDYSKTTSYDVEWIGEESVIVINLKP